MTSKRATMHWGVFAAIVLIGMLITYHFLRDSGAVLGPAAFSSPELAEEVRTGLAIKFFLMLWVPVVWFFVRIPSLLRRFPEPSLHVSQSMVAGPLAQGIIREVAFVLFGGLLFWFLYPEVCFTILHSESALLNWCSFFGDGSGFWVAFSALALASLVYMSWLTWFFCLLAAAFMVEQTQYWIWGCFGRVFLGYHGTPYTLWVLFGDVVAVAWVAGIFTWRARQDPTSPPRPA